MKNLFTSILFVCGLVLTATAQCTGYSIVQNAAPAFSPCSTDSLEYLITNTTLNPINGTITVHLPTSLNITATGLGVQSSPSVSASGTFPSTDPVFTISNWTAGSQINLSIIVETSCIGSTNQSGAVSVDIYDGLTTQNCTNVGAPLFINIPSLNVNAMQNSTLFYNVGDQFSLSFEVSNAGSVSIADIMANISAPTNTTMLGYELSTNPTAGAVSVAGAVNTISVSGTELSTLGLGNELSPGSSFYVHLFFSVNGCSSGVNPGDIHFAYGNCASPCGPIGSFIYTVSVHSGIPFLSVTAMDPNANPWTYSGLCTSTQTAKIGMTYKNTAPPVSNAPVGSNKLTNLEIYVYGHLQLGQINPGTVILRTASVDYSLPVTPVAQSTSQPFYFYKIDFSGLAVVGGNRFPFGSNTLADLDNDGFVDDLNEGDQFTLIYDYNYVDGSVSCPDMFACTGGDLIAMWTQQRYRNQCGVDPGYWVDYNNVGLGSTASAGIGYATTPGASALTAPADVTASDPHFMLEVCPEYNVAFSPSGFNFNCDNVNGYYQIRLELPPGYHVSTASSITIPLLSGWCGTSSIVVDPSDIQEFIPTSGNGYALITLDAIPLCLMEGNSDVDRLYNMLCFQIPMYLSCTDGNTSTENFGFDEISFSLLWICDPDCNTCNDCITTGQTSIFHHCEGECESEFSTDNNFVFERITLGLENIPNPGYYDCCTLQSAIPVTSSTPGIRLDRGYPADEIKLTVTGSFNGDGTLYDEMFLQIRHDQMQGVVGSVFDFSTTSTSEIIVNGTDHYAITGIDSETGPNGEVVYNFQLGSTFISTLGTSASVTFSAEIYLRVKSTQTAAMYFPYGVNAVESLRAEFMGHRTASALYDYEVSCDHWGAVFSVLQPQVSAGSNFLYSDPVTTCAVKSYMINLAIYPATWQTNQQDFPNEYRPYASLDTTFNVVVPAGYEYVSSSLFMSNEYFGNTNIPNLPVVVSGDPNTTGITIQYNGLATNCSPSNCNSWPAPDVFTSHPLTYVGIELFLQPICNAALSGGNLQVNGLTYSGNINAPGYEYTESLSTQTPIFHAPPSLTIVNVPTLNVFTNTATFEFQLCDNSGVASPFTWISAEDPSGNLVFTSVTNTNTSTTYTPSNFTAGTGTDSFFFLSNLAGNSCTIYQLEANLVNGACPSGTSPETFSFNVSYGQECTVADLTPSTTTLANCVAGSELLTYTLYPSAINLNVAGSLPNTPIDLCTGTLIYNFQIENPEEGFVNDPSFWMELPQGISFISGTASYCGSAPESLAVPSPMYNGIGWEFENYFSALSPDGLPGNLNSCNIIDITVELGTSCSFPGGATIDFYASGLSSCNDPLQAGPIQHAPVINGAIPTNLIIGANISSEFINCNDSVQVEVTLSNYGDYDLESNIVTLTIPQEFSCSSFNFPVSQNGNNYDLSVPLVSGSAGSTTITFNIILSDPQFCANDIPIEMNWYGVETIVCADLNECEQEIHAEPYTILVSGCCGGCFADAGPGGKICLGDNITLNASGGDTYLWQPGNLSGPTITVSPSVNTIYTVFVTTANGDTCSDYVEVLVNALFANANITNVSCGGYSDGSITVTAGGSEAPYTYNWINPSSTDETITGLSGGIYTVEVTDGNGCMISEDFSVSEPTQLTSFINSTSVNCFGGSNGTATVTANGGTLPYSYLWSNGSTSNTISGLAAGNYSVTVTDNNGCTSTANVTISEPTQLTSIINSTNVNCFAGSNGTASVTANGGTLSYSYLWSNGSTSNAITGLTAGNYSVTVTDNNGCTSIANVTISEPTQLTSFINSTNVNCFGGSNGTATVTANGGTLPYSYLWSNGSTSNTITGLTAGNYSVTVTDNNGCASIANVTISEPAVLVAHAYNTPVLCAGGSNGSVSAIAGGGTPAYTYFWPTLGLYGDSQTGLTAGIYPVEVTDANGCTATSSVEVTQPKEMEVDIKIENTKCGLCNGSANLTVIGGTAPYSYVWNFGPTTPNVNGLCPGTYTCTITDANGCIKVVTVTILSGPVANVTVQSTNVTCNGACNGTATVAVTGSAVISYLWNDPTSQTTATATHLCAGTYTCHIVTDNGCEQDITVTISEPPVLSYTATIVNVSSCTIFGFNGSATIYPSGGTAPYSYLWSNGSTSPTRNNLGAGLTYTCIVTDANGCTVTASVTIGQDSQIVGNLSATNVTCNGACNGTATANPTGGSAPYTYAWTMIGNVPVGNTQTVTGLCPGLYFCQVTDSRGCKKTFVISISESPAFTLYFGGISSACNGVNGSATVNVFPPAGGPYTYLWSNGETNATATHLPSGTNSVTVTNANGCSVTSTVFIQNTQFSITVSQISPACNGSGGSATVTATPPFGSYTYLWSNGQTTATATNLPAGLNSVTVSRPNGCSVTATINISNSTFTINTSQISAACNGAGGSATVSASPSGTYTYLWSNGQTTATATNLSPGTYTVIVTNAAGCSVSGSVVISNSVFSISATQISGACNGINGSASVTVNPSFGSYTYLWSSGETTSVATHLSSGTNWVTVTNANGCSRTQFVFIQNTAFTINAIQVTPACNGSGGSATVSVNPVFGSYSYLWSNGQTTANATNLSPGVYTVTVSRPNGCSVTQSVTIQNTVINITANNCKVGYIVPGTPNPCVAFAAYISGGVAPYTYQWSNGGGSGTTASFTSATFCSSTNATYTLTVTDANGCSVQRTYTYYVIDARCGTLGTKYCHNGVVTCVPQIQALINAYLNNHPGAQIGNCENPCLLSPGMAEVNDVVPQLAEEHEIALRASPNPVSSTARIEVNVPVKDEVTLNVYDLTGKMIAGIYQGELEAELNYTFNFEAGELEPGIYLVMLTTASGETKHIKLVVSR